MTTTNTLTRWLVRAAGCAALALFVACNSRSLGNEIIGAMNECTAAVQAAKSYDDLEQANKTLQARLEALENASPKEVEELKKDIHYQARLNEAMGKMMQAAAEKHKELMTQP